MTWDVIEGDCLEVMAGLADCSVQTCVTSPPYFNLRDYGIAGQIGVERTPEAYVARLVEVFREVRRLLRDDGTAWLNLGDSFASPWPCNRRNVIGAGSLDNGKREARPQRMGFGTKEKDLMMMPHRVAIALQDDGWWVRGDIVWHKPNPMPESVRDRPTRAHEYIFLLAKNQDYYYDADAIKEQPAESSMKRIGQANFANQTGGPKDYRNGINPNRSMRQTLENFAANPGRNKRDVWTVTTKPCREAHFATFPPDLIEPCILAGAPVGGMVLDPFSGAGTTGMVSVAHGRAFTGIELNPDYCAIARRRIAAAAAQPALVGVA
jgi:DNA modification methylase